MSDRYRIADSDNRGEHARLTRPILVLITVLIQSVIATRVTRDDKLPDKLSGFSTFFSFLSLSFPRSPLSPFLRFLLFPRLFAFGQPARHFQRVAVKLWDILCTLQLYTNLSRLTEISDEGYYSKIFLG